MDIASLVESATAVPTWLPPLPPAPHRSFYCPSSLFLWCLQVPYVLVLAVRPEEGAGAPPPDTDGKGKHLPIAMQPYEGPLRYPHLSTFLKIAAFQLGWVGWL